MFIIHKNIILYTFILLVFFLFCVRKVENVSYLLKKNHKNIGCWETIESFHFPTLSDSQPELLQCCCALFFLTITAILFFSFFLHFELIWKQKQTSNAKCRHSHFSVFLNSNGSGRKDNFICKKLLSKITRGVL